MADSKFEAINRDHRQFWDSFVRFSTYAAWWIRSAMQDFVLRNWSIVRTGTTAAGKSLFFKLRGLRARLGDLEGRLTGERLTGSGRHKATKGQDPPQNRRWQLARELDALLEILVPAGSNIRRLGVQSVIHVKWTHRVDVLE